MAITDDQVAILRAALAQDAVEHDRISARLDSADGWGDYPVLCQAAFFEAVDRRFGDGHTHAEIIQFVAEVRARSAGTVHDVDPQVAERLVLTALGEGSASDLDDKTVVGTEIALLGALITDENLDDAGLDEFLEEARKLAEESMSS